MIMFLSIAALLLLAWFGAPLFTLILSVAMLGFIHQEIDLTVIPIEIYRLTNTPMLLALPLFTLAGYLMSARVRIRIFRGQRWRGCVICISLLMTR